MTSIGGLFQSNSAAGGIKRCAGKDASRLSTDGPRQTLALSARSLIPKCEISSRITDNNRESLTTHLLTHHGEQGQMLESRPAYHSLKPRHPRQAGWRHDHVGETREL